MINNKNFSRETAKKLQSRKSILYTPESEKDWGYSHHAIMADSS